MTDIDKQRIAAVIVLETLGCKWDGQRWNAAPPLLTVDSDGRISRVDDVSEEADALYEALASPDRDDSLFTYERAALKAYEEKRWPDGKVPGGKG